MSRTDFLNPVKDGTGVVEPSIVDETLNIPPWGPPESQERLDLCAEQDPPARSRRPIQRLNPIPIPRGNDDLPYAIVYDHGEFAAQVCEEGGAVVKVKQEDEF